MSYVAIIACCLLGAFFIFNYIKAGELNRMVGEWPQTKGVILNTKYVRGGIRSNPELLVNYEFYVEGKRYESDRIYLNHWQYAIDNQSEIEKLDFIKNPEVKYNPLDPQRCCLLLYPNHWVYKFLLILGIILSIVGMVGLLFRFLK